jgi:L-iditol 2-dehydrogenase
MRARRPQGRSEVGAACRGAVVAAPGKLEIRDLDMPVAGEYQVRCENLFGAICAGTDRHLVEGRLPLPGIEYPFVLGHETIGRVIDVGARVRHLCPGDLVTRTVYPARPGLQSFWGGFTEFGLATDFLAMRADGCADDAWRPHAIHQRLPPDVDPAAATMMITWRETYSYLSRLELPQRARVLIVGSGGNGFAFAVLARLLGAAVVCMAGNPHWAELASRAGVARFADYRCPADLAALAQAAPEGFDAMVDAVGRTGGLENVVELLKPGGTVCLYGIDDLGERMGYLGRLREQGIDVRGPGEYSEGEAHDAVLELLVSGALDASLWFDPAAPPPLEQIHRGFAGIAAKRSLKALVRLRG